MTTKFNLHTVTPLPRPVAAAAPPRRAASWQPQHTSLTREELRKIVIDVIG